MYILCCLFLYLIQILKMVFLYDLFFDIKKRKSVKSVLLIILGCLCFYIASELNLCNPIFPYILFIVYETAVIYKKVNYKMTLTGIWAICIIGLLDEITRIITEKLLLILDINNFIVQNLISNVMTLLFLAILSILIRRKSKNKIESISIFYYVFFLFLTFSNTLIIIFLNEYVFKEVKTDNIVLLYGAFLWTTIGMFLEIAMVMMLAVSRNVYKEKNELNKRFLEEQKNHYRYLEERELETKIFRHDIRKHMNYIAEAWHGERYDEAGQYIEAVYGRIGELGNSLTLHNGIVDAVLNKYHNDAKKEKVSLNVSGQLPTECNVEAFDLCTIFSNLLANAIEAACNSEERFVDVECGYNNNKILLSVSNSYNGMVEVKDGKYVTSKKNSNYHGYGLINVERSVNKYSGYINIEADEKFVVNISLNNKSV